jgi:hypothetical protein
MGTSTRSTGYILLTAGALLILARIAGVHMQIGLAGVQSMLSPFDVWNLVAVALTFTPGAMLFWLGRAPRSAPRNMAALSYTSQPMN